jgi:XTP/dITP diphosphohydrolase
MKIVFATQNQNKVKEIASILPNSIEIVSLADINCHQDIPETSPTIEGNAIQKATYVQEHFNLNCFADDTGLEIEALNGEPGVYSARYAGEAKNAEANMNKVLEKLNNQSNRKARFKTVIALIINNKLHTFEGVVNGNITENKKGEKGFGYDPIFIPEGYTQTFAELSLEEKNTISHRAIATKKLIDFLQKSL